MNCSLCEMSFSVQYKGVSAINRHATSKKHVTRIEEVKSNKDMGAYVEKNREDKFSVLIIYLHNQINK